MELVEWREESTKQSHQKAQIDTVFEVGTEIDDFEVQFVQMFVDERHEGFLYNLKFFRCVVKESIESIAFATHSNVVVSAGYDFVEFSKRKRFFSKRVSGKIQ